MYAILNCRNECGNVVGAELVEQLLEMVVASHMTWKKYMVKFGWIW